MPESRTVLSLYKSKHQIVIDLGDDAEDYEREGIHSILDGALDVMAGKKKSIFDPERFAIMRRIDENG